MKQQKCLEEQLYQIGLVLLVMAVVAVPLFELVILPRLNQAQNGCVFLMFLGAYCPGCGGTRSVHALLHGHVLQSLWYHPLVPYSAAIYLVFMASWTLARFGLFGVKKGIAFRSGYMYGMIAIVVVNFIVKNLLKFCFDIIMV